MIKTRKKKQNDKDEKTQRQTQKHNKRDKDDLTEKKKRQRMTISAIPPRPFYSFCLFISRVPQNKVIEKAFSTTKQTTTAREENDKISWVYYKY